MTGTTRQRGRRRGEVLERALLDAAWAELSEKGYAGLTMDAVAVRAETSRPVLYRRWPDKNALVRATIAHTLADHPIDLPDTGSLREDTLTLMRQVNRSRAWLTSVLAVHLAGYYEETGTRPSDLSELVGWRNGAGLDTLFDRAAARGEIDISRLSPRLRTLPFDLLRHEFMMTLAPASQETLEEIVDQVWIPTIRAVAAR